METALAGDDLSRTFSNQSISQRMSLTSSTSRRSWASTSIREVWNSPSDGFQKSSREEDEEELKWAAIERLPTYNRLTKGLLRQVLDDGKINYEEVDVNNLGMHEKKQLMESILKVVEDDNEKFLLRLRERTDR